MKMKEKYIVNIEDGDVTQTLLDVANILVRLRYHTIHWENEYGSEAKNAKKDAERKADVWLSKYCIKVDE